MFTTNTRMHLSLRDKFLSLWDLIQDPSVYPDVSRTDKQMSHLDKFQMSKHQKIRASLNSADSRRYPLWRQALEQKSEKQTDRDQLDCRMYLWVELEQQRLGMDQ